MKQFNCIVLEDSLNDQLSIALLLNQYLEIKPFYTNSPQSFMYEMAHNRYNLVITDIKLSGTVTGIDPATVHWRSFHVGDYLQYLRL